MLNILKKTVGLRFLKASPWQMYKNQPVSVNLSPADSIKRYINGTTNPTMKYFRSLLGTIVIVFNFCYTAQAQADLSVLRASSINQGTHHSFSASYPRVIKYAREAAAAAGFAIESSERVGDDVYMILGRKTVAGDRYGEVIRLLTIRKDQRTSEVRLLVRQRVAANTLGDREYAQEIYTKIKARLSSANT